MDHWRILVHVQKICINQSRWNLMQDMHGRQPWWNRHFRSELVIRWRRDQPLNCWYTIDPCVGIVDVQGLANLINSKLGRRCPGLSDYTYFRFYISFTWIKPPLFLYFVSSLPSSSSSSCRPNLCASWASASSKIWLAGPFIDRSAFSTNCNRASRFSI